MKKILFAVLSLVLVMSSCEDFLDSEDVTNKTNDNYPANEKEATELIIGIYSQLLFESPETSSQYYIAQLASDDCLGGNLSFSGNCATNFLMYKDNLNLFSGIWGRCYRMIARSNNAFATLDNVPNWSSEEARNLHFGEAYFLRAFAYNELVQVFGGVPLRLELSSEVLPRSSVDEVYAVIASDLKNAIELLPNKIYPAGNSMEGRVTKYAAEAMMARVFLFYTGRYDKTELPGGITKEMVINWVDDCVTNSGHDLVSDQRNLWAYTNKASQDNTAGHKYQYVIDHDLQWEGNGSKETLFANKHKLKGNNWTYTQYSNTVAQFYSPSADNYTKAESYPFGSGWGAGPVSPAMINEWKVWADNQTYLNGATTDPRLSGSVWSYKAIDPHTGDVIFDRSLDPGEPAYTVSYRYFEQTGYQEKKYINVHSFYQNDFKPFGFQLYPEESAGTPTSLSLTNIADLIHIRFADVLLMQSELKGDAEGLNRVRARSNLAPVAYSLEAIKNERRWEFAFESIRWWDLLRWSGPSLEYAGNALNKQTGFTLINAAEIATMPNFNYKARLQKTQGYWPIPQVQIDLSGGVIEQNPGWDASAQFTDWSFIQ